MTQCHHGYGLYDRLEISDCILRSEVDIIGTAGGKSGNRKLVYSDYGCSRSVHGCGKSRACLSKLHLNGARSNTTAQKDHVVSRSALIDRSEKGGSRTRGSAYGKSRNSWRRRIGNSKSDERSLMDDCLEITARILGCEVCDITGICRESGERELIRSGSDRSGSSERNNLPESILSGFHL